jgi:hypothetical protein
MKNKQYKSMPKNMLDNKIDPLIRIVNGGKII